MTPERYRAWLQLLVDGNQNMIRVWGGGIYENDAFYDICDGMLTVFLFSIHGVLIASQNLEVSPFCLHTPCLHSKALQVLVWQDFMFGCGQVRERLLFSCAAKVNSPCSIPHTIPSLTP